MKECILILCGSIIAFGVFLVMIAVITDYYIYLQTIHGVLGALIIMGFQVILIPIPVVFGILVFGMLKTRKEKKDNEKNL